MPFRSFAPDLLLVNATVHTMASPQVLRTRLEAEPSFLARLAYVVTDMHFGSTENGLDVGRLVKPARPDLPVLLSSDGVFAVGDLAGAADRVIGKNPVGLDRLRS